MRFPTRRNGISSNNTGSTKTPKVFGPIMKAGRDVHADTTHILLLKDRIKLRVYLLLTKNMIIAGGFVVVAHSANWK
jgi:hypothetical protein